MDDIIARLDRSLTLEPQRDVLVVRDARKRHLCKLQDATNCQDLCGHRYTRSFLVDWWLEKTKTPNDNLCPYCNHSGTRPGVLLRAERGCSPRNLLLPLVGKQVEGPDYNPAVILNQEELFRALFRGEVQEIDSLLPEFYGHDEDGEPICPLGMNQESPLQIQLQIGKGFFGKVFRLQVNDENLQARLDVPVVVKSLDLESKLIADEFTAVRIPDTRMPLLQTSNYMNEVLLSSLASRLVTRPTKSRPCPNFPVVFGFFSCGEKDDNNDDDDGKEEEEEEEEEEEDDDVTTGHVLMEALDADFSSSDSVERRGIYALIDKGVQLNAEMLRGVAFQVSFAIAMLGDMYGMTHNDAKVDNVLAKVLTEDQRYVWNGRDLAQRDLAFEYIVGNTRFVLPNSGVLAKLADFGISASYGRPLVMLRSTAAKKRDEIPEFALRSKDFRPGADISYFVASFAQETCFEAFTLLQDQAQQENDQLEATRIRRRASEIVVLANDMLFELVRQRGPLGKRRRADERNFTKEMRSRFSAADTIPKGWLLASEGGVFKDFSRGIPGHLLSQKVDALMFLLNCPAFSAYKTAAERTGETIQMGHHSGLPVPVSRFPVIPD